MPTVFRHAVNAGLGTTPVDVVQIPAGVRATALTIRTGDLLEHKSMVALSSGLRQWAQNPLISLYLTRQMSTLLLTTRRVASDLLLQAHSHKLRCMMI